MNTELRPPEWPRRGGVFAGGFPAASTAVRREGSGNTRTHRAHPDGNRWRAMIVEDNRSIRESLSGLLVEDGYDVVLAENGQEALQRMRREIPVDIVVLDLRMPVMDGWEFRAIQKNDERLKHVPVVAISADGSPQAVAISADAYLRKPLDSEELLRTLERLLREREVEMLTQRLRAAEPLASLGRLAAGVGHEINNPLSFVGMNLNLSLDRLKQILETAPPPGGAAGDLAEITRMLTDAEVGLERIRRTVQNLQKLTPRGETELREVDVNAMIEQSVAMVWNQIVHRARFVDRRGTIPLVRGDGVGLGQVFLNLVLNAAQAIPEGHAERNEITIVTRLEDARVVIEISDTGTGISPDDMARVFEPFFTTKPVGAGTGLGLSICRQTILDHGGELLLDSELGRGTRVRVLLPAVAGAHPGVPAVGEATGGASPIRVSQRRGRVLLIDDESLIGRVVNVALRERHDVVWHAHGAEAIAALEAGQRFDLILCDLAMPDLLGPDIYRIIEERWPAVASSVVFMTGGAFTPTLQSFAATTTLPVLAKPFNVDKLRELARDYVLRAVAREEGASPPPPGERQPS